MNDKIKEEQHNPFFTICGFRHNREVKELMNLIKLPNKSGLFRF
jgi:hypothetical protein